MSAKAKNQAAQRRKREHAMARAAKVAKYEGYKAAGQNSKSKRFLQNNARVTVNTFKHAMVYCGNAGCMSCFPLNMNPWLKKDGTPKNGMPHWIWLRFTGKVW